ncbi:MAG: VTT domain-containing protein [Geminicoccaceae bacterium]|nr:VTT domain-containing protein [Geminicoccaceae bacterium]
MTPILVPGRTCQGTARASRAALLVDGERYFAALAVALERARHSVFVLGWDVDGRIGVAGEPLDRRLRRLVAATPGLEVRILVWDWLFLHRLERRLWPGRRFDRGPTGRIHLRLDGERPVVACRHEKVVVVDGELAFCGGIDLADGRYDSQSHPDDGGVPFHDAMLMVEGPAARLLEAHALGRWRETGEGAAPAPPPSPAGRLWPSGVAPLWRDVPLGLARTAAAPLPVREIEALLLAAIGAARDALYVESQYLTAPAIVAAVAAGLRRPKGPDVVAVGPLASQGFLERAVMDAARVAALSRLRDADRFGRFRALAPMQGGTPIHVHSKLVIVDDRLLVIGSANLARRSLGLDTECSVALEPLDAAGRHAVAAVRAGLLAEHLGAAPPAVEAVTRTLGSLAHAVDALNPETGRRLVPLPTRVVDADRGLLDLTAAGDPDGPGEALEVLAFPLGRSGPSGRLHRAVLPVAVAVLLAAAFRGALAPYAALLPGSLGDAGAGVVAFLLLVLVGLAFLPFAFAVFLAGAAFGTVAGFALGLLAAAFAAGLGWLGGRRLPPPVLHRLGGRRIGAFRERMEERPRQGLAMLRLVPGGPFAAVSLAAGLAAVPPLGFLLITVLLAVPGTALFALLGSSLRDWILHPDRPSFAVVALVPIVLLLGLDLIERRQARTAAQEREAAVAHAVRASAQPEPTESP